MKSQQRPARSSWDDGPTSPTRPVEATGAGAPAAPAAAASGPSSIPAAELSASIFGVVGAGLAMGGILSILTGVPTAAHGLRPPSGWGDALARLGEISPLLSAAGAALVAAAVVLLLGARRLRAVPSGVELVVLGAVVVACALGASGRFGYATDGSVLPAAVAWLSGGVATVAAGVVAVVLGGPSASRPSASR